MLPGVDLQYFKSSHSFRSFDSLIHSNLSVFRCAQQYRSTPWFPHTQQLQLGKLIHI